MLPPLSAQPKMIISFMFGILVIVAPMTAVADPLTPFSCEFSAVSVAEVEPYATRPENLKNEFYTEWWSFIFRLDGGYWAYVQFLSTNMGPGDGMARVNAKLRLPDGDIFQSKETFEASEWGPVKGGDGIDIRFGKNRIYGQLDALKLHLENSSFSADLDLKNVVPPWKPGNGRAQYGKSSDRYLVYHLLAPLARVTGVYHLVEEDEDHPIGGFIHSDHVASSVGIHELTRTLARMRVFTPDLFFVYADVQPPRLYGDVPIRFAVMFKDGKLVFQSTDFNVDFSKIWVDPKKDNYSVPGMIEIRSKDGQAPFHGIISSRKMTNREDHLETANAAERFILSKFVKPVEYQHEGVFAIKVKNDVKEIEYRGKGAYEYFIVNP